MGQEIVYCFKCQNRLLGSDFDQGKAFRVEGKAACLSCVRELFAHLPDPDAELDRLKKSAVPRPPGAGSSSRIPIVKPDSTTRISTQRMRSSPADAAPPAKPKTLILLAVAGGIVLLLVLAFAMSGDRKRPPPSDPEISKPTPPPRDPGPKPPPREGASEKLARELEELDARTQLLLRQDKLQDVSRILTAARSTHDIPDWHRAIDERMEKVEAAARRLAEPLLAQVGEAARRGDAAALNDLKSRLAAFGVPALAGEFDKAAAAAAADPWVALDLENLVSEGGATLTRREDRSVLASGPNPTKDTFKATARVGLKQVRAFRLEALSDPALPSGGPGRAQNGNIVLTEFKVVADGKPLAFSGASGDHEQDKYPSSAAVDGNPLTGWALQGRLGQSSTAIFHLQSPVDIDSLSVTLECQSFHPYHVLGCFRLSASIFDLPPPGPARYAEAHQPPPPPPELPPAVRAYREKWTGVARLAAARNFSAAVKMLEDLRAGLPDDVRKEADADLADFKLAAEALAEVPRLLPRWTKGTRIKLEFIGESGWTELLEGSVVDASARGVTVQAETGILDVPAGELGASSIVALMALRGEKRATDARAAAVLGALEGRAMPDVPKRFESIRETLEPAEAEARRAFWGAEDDFAGMRTRGAAGAGYAALLQKATSFATRNKAFIEDRLAATRDLFFFPDDLVGGGTFTSGSSSKMESYWISTADSPPAKTAANFVEAEVLVQPGATYRAWVYAGGCCQEVFTLFLQGTGLSGPSAKNPKETVTAEPGGDDWISVKQAATSLKKKHSDHTGPKEPDRWMWADLGALKFADSGPKKLRIVTDQKGLSIAYLAVSAVRQAQPREVEVRDLVKGRPPADVGPTGMILREVWRGISGDGVGNLTGNPKFKDGKPDQSGTISIFDSSGMGTEYGCRIRGYVHPPLTGEYVFWIASDDHGELWLSTDETPAKKQRISWCNKAVPHLDWTADPGQKSAAIPLTAGRRYYVEVLQKQGGGPEHVAVGWQLPGGAMERPIPGTRLSAWGSIPARKIQRPQFRPSSPEGPVVKSALAGGKGGTVFEEAPEPRQFLRGFKYSLSTSGCLRTLQALYLGPSGESEGARRGAGANTLEVVAKPGYAVGGMVARGTDRLNSFKLIFMRVSGPRLVPTDRYESGWIGTRGGGKEVTMGGDGAPVLGFYGQAGGEIDAGGLLLLGK